MKLLARLILKLAGWKIDYNHIPTFRKSVVIQAPHTSNWDFIIGTLVGSVLNVSPKIFIKKSLFFFPLGFILKKLGGIPVDRKTKGNLVEEMAYQISIHDDFSVVIAPEGTRSYEPNWKKGFYYIAQATNVPIIPFYIDYKNKVTGFDRPFELSEDIDADIEKLKVYFKQFTGRNPENGIR